MFSGRRGGGVIDSQGLKPVFDSQGVDSRGRFSGGCTGGIDFGDCGQPRGNEKERDGKKAGGEGPADQPGGQVSRLPARMWA